MLTAAAVSGFTHWRLRSGMRAIDRRYRASVHSKDQRQTEVAEQPRGLPIDRLLWTERTDELARGLGKSQPGLGIWIAGDPSPRAEAGLKGLGITLVQRCGKQLPLLD
jgi:hypothetical protein